MATEDRFKKSVVLTLARRAATRCSNPDCGAITSGPTDTPDGTVNVGEAAHIYGANPGSARYDPAMVSADRSAITNAIWLCSNCHKLVDDDPTRYPAGLLYEWQREHEQRIAEQVGKAAAEVRRRYERRHLEDFGRLSYLAERIIIEKGDYWEYLLTAEALRYEIGPVVRRWNALKRGLYVKPSIRIPKVESLAWFSDKLQDISHISHAFGELANVELKRSWGDPGVAGNDTDIITTCRLFGEVCASALTLEESVRFAAMDECFTESRDLFMGVAGAFLDHAEKIPEFLVETFSSKPTSGIYELVLTIEMPEGWADAVGAAMKRAVSAL